MGHNSRTNETKVNRANKGEVRWTKKWFIGMTFICSELALTRTFNVFPKFIYVDMPFSNRYDVTYIKKRFQKNVLHKRDKEKKKLDAELTKKIQ